MARDDIHLFGVQSIKELLIFISSLGIIKDIEKPGCGERNMIEDVKIEGCTKVSPNKLYPLTTIASIVPHTLQFVYNGNMYMMDGNYEMLAANIINKESVDVEVMDRTELPFWNIDENIKDTLQAVSISALYDFEAVGGFMYEDYPIEHKRA